MKHESTKNGEPIIWQDGWFHSLQCCDCGLIHKVAMSITKNKVEVKFYRDDYDTQKHRKKKKIILYRKTNAK